MPHSTKRIIDAGDALHSTNFHFAFGEGCPLTSFERFAPHMGAFSLHRVRGIHRCRACQRRKAETRVHGYAVQPMGTCHGTWCTNAESNYGKCYRIPPPPQQLSRVSIFRVSQPIVCNAPLQTEWLQTRWWWRMWRRWKCTHTATPTTTTTSTFLPRLPGLSPRRWLRSPHPFLILRLLLPPALRPRPPPPPTNYILYNYILDGARRIENLVLPNVTDITYNVIIIHYIHVIIIHDMYIIIH